jgi:lysophospholipase L1-like esterase
MRRFSAAPVVAALVLAACTLSACGATPIAGTRPSSSAPARVVYAAIGASETFGIGASDRSRQAWPQVFSDNVLPRSAVLHNFGIPGATTAQALHDEVPAALAVHPTVATVWLNVNDLINGVAAQDYEAQLRQVLRELRRGGQARVLVANTPDLAQLPAYRACLPGAPPGGPRCLIPSQFMPTPQAVATAVADYNAAISDAARQEGATLVDLHLNDSQISQHPEWISADGFHPSGQCYAMIAKQFEEAYRRAG